MWLCLWVGRLDLRDGVVCTHVSGCFSRVLIGDSCLSSHFHKEAQRSPLSRSTESLSPNRNGHIT